MMKNDEQDDVDVVNVPTNIDFQCNLCEYVGKSDRSLSAHKRHRHPRPEGQEDDKKPRGRPKKYEDSPVPLQRVTTKQLLGGRKRPKTIVECVDDSAIRTDKEASRLHGLGIIDEETSLGDYVRRGANYQLMGGSDMNLDGNSMIVGQEVVIDHEEDEENDDSPMLDSKFVQNRTRTAFRRYPNDRLPDRLTIGDANGKYKCYMPDCLWKGGYRSLRMDHMKAIHPEWKMPSRFLLERISKDGKYVNPEEHVPQYACQVKGCNWRGNFRASRSSHMRKVHPNEHAERKRNAPGYNSNGTYNCHFPLCQWRGWSRSTRSTHLRKAHPEWRPDDNRVMTVLSCFYCKSSFHTYAQLADHTITHGGLALMISQSFDNKHHFSAWLQQMERVYSVTFERSEFGSDPELQDLHNYVLHCDCVGGRGEQLATDSRAYIYQKHNFLKRRHPQLLTRNKNDCCVHLEVREDSEYGPIHVKGTLEHTGHRFGTPLLRMSPMDRQIYSEVLSWKEQRDFQFMALDVVEKLNVFEGFTMDHYTTPRSVILMEPLHTNQFQSLREFIEAPSTSTYQNPYFSVDFGDSPEQFSFGYMSDEMQKLWSKYAPGRTITIDSSPLEFGEVDLFQYSVIVTDENYIPKCAMIYVTTDNSRAPHTILRQMKAVEPRPPTIFMVDPSQLWVELIQDLWPTDLDNPESEVTILISEWTLMDYWAAKTEELVKNEFDVFCIVTALRRMLRVEDAHQLYYTIVELFEAFFECGYDGLAEFFDAQLSDMEYFKRWGPLHRTTLTSHAHPTLGASFRILRDWYLNPANMDHDAPRVDQWFSHICQRIEDFNAITNTQTYTLRPLDPPHKFFYTTVEDEEGEEAEHENPFKNPQILMYDDDGDEVVVEEEIIGHEIDGASELQGSELPDEEVIYETYEDYPEYGGHYDLEEEHKMHHNMRLEEEELQQHLHEQQKPEHLSHQTEELGELQDHHHHHHHHLDEDPEATAEGPSEIVEHDDEEEQEDLVDVEMVDDQHEQHEIPAKIPPHRQRLYQKLDPMPVISHELPRSPSRRIRIPTRKIQELDQESVLPPPPRRETTRSVVRSRKRRDRFAELRDCPPEVMRAIAAHAIAYDGRKKEQRPIVYVPRQAKMAMSSTPTAPTPPEDYDGPPGHQMTTILQHQRQAKQEEEEEQWSGEYDDELHEQEHDPATSSPPPSLLPHTGPSEIVHHEEEVHMMLPEEEADLMDDDDQQPCTSASMYR
ncbi:C2H2-type domain-containing protein [Caenorhabditis elegans]|uniref:C2H2-type domain-containing protein n=1 Tax=Caenorhabditis elegans TaxID=6239 RepID=G4S460_CAEEL|nr:C2H2-type domain-containing protein [Caenorhabditis elegans]CCD66089.1 C2H2-type domain-containing protein [Caenorhabditis elegans]|eukprot:NP_001254828.1 AT hook Transcription Factor family [Caenorhabditis elegans]